MEYFLLLLAELEICVVLVVMNSPSCIDFVFGFLLGSVHTHKKRMKNVFNIKTTFTKTLKILLCT